MSVLFVGRNGVAERSLGYIPNLALCVVGLVVFGALAATYRTGLYRQGRRFMLTLCISTTTMAVGFGLMIGCRKHYDSKGWAIAETLFILLSPCGFIAQDYVILPRLATALDASDCLFLRPNWIARIFVGSDIVTFLIQAVGGAMTISNKASTAKTGKTVGNPSIARVLADLRSAWSASLPSSPRSASSHASSSSSSSRPARGNT